MSNVSNLILAVVGVLGLLGALGAALYKGITFINRVQASVEVLEKALVPNGGPSLRDRIDTIDSKVDVLTGRVDQLTRSRT